jgi:glycosyltransferase involved in cell wall biosynthesis
MTKSFFSLGNECFRNGDYKQAITYYHKAIELDPSFSLYHSSLMAAVSQLNQRDSGKVVWTATDGGTEASREFSKDNLNTAEAESKQRTALQYLNISNMCTWLWGGFANLASERIKACLRDKRYKTGERAHGAFELGRWHAHRGEWKESLEVLSSLSQLDKRKFRSKRCKLLRCEAEISLGLTDSASEIIEFELSKSEDPDFICAKSNLLLAKQGIKSCQSRMALINKIFANKKLNSITFPPNKPLSFGQLKCEVAKNQFIESDLKVSILMPVFNAENYIETSVLSMLSQTWRNIEIIAVEDCGTDSSWDKLQYLAKQDSRLKIYRNSFNMGAYPTRNRALSLSTGDYITVHDSDDWSHPQIIEVQLTHMLKNPHLKATFTFMTRVYDNMMFMLRPQRGNLNYVHRSYPSLLMKKEDISHLGEWDAVTANADDELVQRIRELWGPDAIQDVISDTPLSFFLVHPNSLTQQKGTSLNTLAFGIRHEYSRQAKYWRENKEKAGTALRITRRDMKDPFPIPLGLAPKNWKVNSHYDIVFISDLSLLGGTRRCNEAYIKAAVDMGLRIALFHWPRFDLKKQEIADVYTDASYSPLVDFIVPEDNVTAELLIIHHPPIIKYQLDSLPSINCKKLGVLVNQLPMQFHTQRPCYYDGPEIEHFLKEKFNVNPVWLSISPVVSRKLNEIGGFTQISNEIWYPPYIGNIPKNLPPLPEGVGRRSKLVLGRHSRDHYTKWPEIHEDLLTAYCCREKNITVRIMGGVENPRKILGEIPPNWADIPFDFMSVPDFIKGLDFFLHFTHSDYIEEFGRNIMEAMALGKVVLLPPAFQDTFGSAAVYCSPQEVAETMRRIWFKPDEYRLQAEKGLAFVERYCSRESIQKRLNKLIQSQV